MSTVQALNSLHIAMSCSKPTGWHAADERTLITAKKTGALTWTCDKRLVSTSGQWGSIHVLI